MTTLACNLFCSNATHEAPIFQLGPRLRCCFQALGQLQLARELFPMVAAVPSAAERTMALGHIWGAVLEQDMATRHARRTGQPGPPATELRSSLSDSFLMDVISAAELGELTGLPSGAARPLGHNAACFAGSIESLNVGLGQSASLAESRLTWLRQSGANEC